MAEPMNEPAGGLAGRRVLVTGASGFIGARLVRRLLAAGADVHALTSTVSAVYPPRLVGLRGSITLHEGSLTDRGAMDALARAAEPAYVWHLGAYTHVGKSWSRVDECVQVNVQGTVNLLQALAPVGYARLVYMGTSEIYGDVPVPFTEDGPVNPVSPYAVSKYAGECFARVFQRSRGAPVVLARPFNAFGPGQSPDRIVPEIIVRALRGQPLPMTQGRQTREFNYVDDLADGLVRLGLAPDVEGEVVNLGCGREVSIRDLAVRLLALLGDPVEPRFGALPDRPTEIWRMYADTAKATRLLGWQPTVGLEEGLRRTVDWYAAELASGESVFAL